MKTKHNMLFAILCLIAMVLMVFVAGCTDEQATQYINDHPDEIAGYVASHPDQINQYIADHPEVLNNITIPITVEPPSTPAMTQTETTTSPTTAPTVIQTESITTSPTSTPTASPTTVIPTTTITTLPTTAPTTVTTTQVIDNTPVPTTLVTIVPEPTPYIIAGTGLPLVSYRKSEYVGYTSDPEIDSIVLSMHAQNSRLDDKSGTASLSMRVKKLTYTDGHVQGVSGSGYIQNSYDFTWSDNLDGTYSISAIGIPKDQRDIRTRTIVVEPNTGYFTISGYEGITFR